MKKITTLKTLLVGLLALGATSAWADEIAATLVHTSSSGVPSKTAGAYVSTIDAEKEYINNGKFGNNNWQGAAYAEFSFTIPAGQSIKSATMVWSGIGSGKDRTTDVMYVMPGNSLDYSETGLASGTAEINLQAAIIETVSFPANTTTKFTTDVTDAVKYVASSQNFVIFKFTNNVGSGNLVGKGAGEDAAPKLVITTADASSQTKYTVKFTDGTSDLKDPVEYDGTIGDPATASDEDLAAFFVDGQKWVYKEGNETITLDGDATANVITLTFREAVSYNYTVNSNLGTTIGKGSAFEGETVKVPYPEFILDNGTMMKAAAKDKEFNYPVTIGEDDVTVTIDYADAKIEGEIVYFKEAEDIEGFTATTGGNANIRCSMSAGGYNGGEEELTITTLEPGKYRIVTQIWGNEGTTFNIVCGSTTLACATKGYIVTYGSEDFTLTEETDVTIPVEGRDGRCFDYIYIIKVPVSYSYTVNAIDKDDNTLFEIAKGTVYEGQDATVAYPAFYLKNGELLQADRIDENKNRYQYTFEVPGDNTVESVIYNSVGIDNVVFYKEAEDIEGLTAVSSGNVPVRCSGAKAAIAEADATITSLDAGLYTISGFAWGNPGTNFEVVAGDKSIATFSTVASTMGIVTSPVFKLTETTDIVLKQGGNGGSSPKVMDYFFIQKVPSTVPVSITAARYATYCSKYDLDFSSFTEIQAFVAEENDGVISFTKTDVIPANTGMLLKGIEDSYDIPVTTGAASVSSALIGVLKDTKVAAGSFVLMGSPYVGFFSTKDEFTVGANTAYFEALSSGARIVLPGNEATAIKTIDAEQLNGEIYNLAGQRVKSAQKGLYIIGGKKVIK